MNRVGHAATTLTVSRISVALLGLASLCGWASAAPSYTFLVDPLIGTDGSGHTFPGATVPFGMVAPSPDNADRDRSAENAFSNAFASGYRFNAPRIQGFSNTHISGGGIPELGDVLLQPAFGTRTGGRARRLEDWSSRYDKSSEWAKPGYYAVTLADLHAHVEVTATQRVALHRYTFPRPGVVQVLVDAQHGLSASTTPRVTASDVTVAGREVAGTVDSRNGVERRAAFVVRFDRAPFKAEKLPEREGDRAPRWVLSFYLQNSTQLQARVAMSTTDVEGARRNLAEADGRWFEVVMRDADRLWAQVLGRVRIEGTERTRRIFYTALYHALMLPSDIADVDGRYRGSTA